MSRPDEKTYRRRRLVFVALVLSAFVLLTGSYMGAFGSESGLSAITSPPQKLASNAAKPFRDLANWVGDSFRAKKDLARRAEAGARAARGQRPARGHAAAGRAGVAAQGLAPQLHPRSLRPAEVTSIGSTSSSWYRSVIINKGTSSGVRERQAVVGPMGSWLRDSRRSRGTAVVRLITDPQSGVTAKVVSLRTSGAARFPANLVDLDGDTGDLAPSRIGTRRDDLILGIRSPTTTAPAIGLYGWAYLSAVPSRFPPNIRSAGDPHRRCQHRQPDRACARLLEHEAARSALGPRRVERQ